MPVFSDSPSCYRSTLWPMMTPVVNLSLKFFTMSSPPTSWRASRCRACSLSQLNGKNKLAFTWDCLLQKLASLWTAYQHIIIKGAIRGKVDLHAGNLLNSHYATGGDTSLNHNAILGNAEVSLHDADVPFKSTGSTNGQGTKNIFQRQLHSRKQTKSYQILW